MGPIGRPETSVRNCHYALRNSLDDRSSQLTKADNNCFVNRDIGQKSNYFPYIFLLPMTVEKVPKF